MPRFRISTHGFRESKDGQHRFEHWYRDNTVYFITARCRDRFPAFNVDRSVSRALELNAFLAEVPYPRYGEPTLKSGRSDRPR